MKALTLYQPWAEAMRLKLKKNETRSWATSHRGWLAIHAARRCADKAILSSIGNGINPSSLSFGAVICIVKVIACEPSEKLASLVDFRERSWGDYSPGRYIWVTCPNS